MDAARLSNALQAGVPTVRDSQDSRGGRPISEGSLDRQKAGETSRGGSSALLRDGGQIGQSIDGLGERGAGRWGTKQQQDEAALVGQAMTLLTELAKLDPRNKTIQSHVRRSQPSADQRPEAAPASPSTEDPVELFGLFARDLHSALMRLAPVRRWASGLELRAIDYLHGAQADIQAAAAWWQARTLARGRAEAQLQELKLFLEGLCSRSSGLAVLLALVETRGQAVRSLLGEVDVLRRILQRAVEDARAILGKRHAGSVSKLEANMRIMSRAEQSIDIIKHLETQLRSTRATPAPLATTEREDVLRDLRRLRGQLDFFRAAAGAGSGALHVSQMAEIGLAIEHIVGWHQLPAGHLAEWERLDAICGLLAIRLRSAESWVDKNALDAIVNDLREAVRLAVESCELEGETAPPPPQSKPDGSRLPTAGEHLIERGRLLAAPAGGQARASEVLID